jgi:hypothetical protein
MHDMSSDAQTAGALHPDRRQQNPGAVFHILLLQRFEYQVWSANTAGQALEMVSVAVPASLLPT